MTGPVFNAGAIEATAKVGRSEFIRDLRRMQADIREFQRKPIELSAKVDRQAIKRDLRVLKEELSKSGDVRLPLSLSTVQAKKDIATFKSYVRGLSPAILSLGISSAQGRRDVAEFRQYIRNLAATNLKVGANTAQARRDVAALKNLIGGTVTLKVDANTLRALAGLQQVNSVRQRLDGSTATVNVAIGSDAGRVIGMIGLITAGLSAVAFLAPAANTAIAGFLATAGSGVQLVGALGFGLAGIGDAYKAMSQETQRAAVAVGKSNSGIASSLRAVDNARRSAARTAATSLRSVEDAERSLARAQDDAEQAQRDLNDARAEEIRQLDELRERVSDFALDQEGAAIRFLEAEEDLDRIRKDKDSTALDIRKAEYELASARERASDLTREEAEATNELVDAERKGVDGSDRVISAKNRIADANERVEDAQRSLQHAQEDAAYSQQEANQAIIDALERVQDAHDSAANAGVAGANRVNYALSQLSPEAQEFAHFLYDEVRPALNEIGDAVAASMLPDLQQSMKQLMTLQPEIQDGLSETGNVIGRLSLAGANLVTSGPFRRDFAAILAGNNRMLQNMGNAGIYLTGSMTSMYAVSQPLVEEFTQWTLESLALFASWVEGKRASGELAQYFELAADRAREVWELFKNLTVTAYDLVVALSPVGETVLDIVNAGLEFLQWLAEVNPELLQVIAYSTLAYAAFINVGKAILSIGSATRLGIAGFARLTQLLSEASLAAGVYTERITGSADAGQKVANAGSRAATALNNVGRALPFVGAAVIAATYIWQEHATAVEEAKEAWLRGGDASDQMTKLLLDQQRAALSSSETNGLLGTALDDVSRQMDEAAAAGRKEFEAMSSLEQAKVRVTQATNANVLAIKLFGPASSQAAVTAEQLATANGILQDEQRKAADAAQSHTDKLIAQRDFMLGTINAEIEYEAALDRLTETVARNGATIDLHTDAGRENQRALNDMARAAITHMEQLIQQGASTEEVTRKEQLYKEQLYNSAIQIGMSEVAARNYVNQLSLVPRDITTTIYADTRPAIREIGNFQDYVRSQQAAVIEIQSAIPPPLPGRAQGAIDFIQAIPMARGGLRVMAAGIANIVSPNTPTLIGDNKRFNESYIPHDRGSSRAHRIFDVTGAALGRTVVPRGTRGMASGGLVGGFGSGSDNSNELTEQLIELTNKALKPLAQQILDSTIPSLSDLQKKTDEDLTNSFKLFGTLTKEIWKGNTDNVANNVADQIKQHEFLTGNYGNMQFMIGQQTGVINNTHLRALQDGMRTTAAVGENVSQAVGTSFARLRSLTADPIRWMIDWPFNAGLVVAWNEIDKFFALGKPMNNLPVNFKQGGGVHGGIADKDSVLINAMPGEFVMPKPMVADFGGIENLERARMASLGGLFRSHGREGMGGSLPGLPNFAIGGAIDNAMDFAKAQVGKPYVWGATGPNGYDCSGLWSAIQNSLLGRNPFSRLYTTSNFSRNSGAAGLIPGLESAFTVGVETGHMGGTLAGTAFEATPPRVRTSPSARGTTNFPMHFFLPEAGGQFVDSVGPAGGIDVEAFVREKMAHALRMANDLTGFFGQGSTAQAGRADALGSINNATRWALANISGATSVSAASGPVIEQVRAVAKRYNWDTGAEWDAISSIIQAESGWNPNAANPTSSARGLFQKMTSIHGPVESTPAGQAEWGMRYIQERYGRPTAALRFRNAHGWYEHGGEITPPIDLFDNGGWLKPGSFGYNGTGQPEAVLSKSQLDTISDRNNSKNRDSPVIGTVVMQLPYGASPQEYVEHLDFELQFRRKKGVYR